MSAISSGIQQKVDSILPFCNRGRLSRWTNELHRVNAWEPAMQKLSDHEIRKTSLSLRYRARSGEPLSKLLPEAFALVREAAKRNVGMRHFDVQILGGIAMFHRSIVEMQTGEGKTLTATAPMYLHALLGRGACLATVNDYLAQRDADSMGPIYRALGLKVGAIQTQMSQKDRREAYTCDVTYGTAKEFGFDFLRDRLLLRRIREGQRDIIGSMMENQGVRDEQPVQRDPYFALVDEADSILIDEARTPLIISAVPTEEQKMEVECYRWAAEVVQSFVEDEDFEYDHDKRTVELTRKGRMKARNIAKPEALDEVGLFHIYEYVERAIKVDREFSIDQQYVIRDGEIVIVDEFTGRLAEGRKWREGIHQSVEAKEGVEITVATGQAARVTVQDYFLRFDHLAGMTGTAMASKGELSKIYRCHVVPIPTNRPPRRKRERTRIFGSEHKKWESIVEEVTQLHAIGRPVLIGTRTIDKSEILSQMLAERGITHNVLNANHIAREAEIVAKAGEPLKVTVSTNMAGRGTDIKIPDEIKELGGLHVICTEMHDSGRIDRQLIGRCGRQGDPGTFRQYLSLDDELLLSGFGPKRSRKLKDLGSEAGDKEFYRFQRMFRRAQRRVERKHFRDRKAMMYFEKERKKMQRSMGQDPYLDTPN